MTVQSIVTLTFLKQTQPFAASEKCLLCKGAHAVKPRDVLGELLGLRKVG